MTHPIFVILLADTGHSSVRVHLLNASAHISLADMADMIFGIPIFILIFSITVEYAS